MDNHLRATLIRHRADLTEEVYQIRPQTLGIDILVAIQRLLELLQSEALLRAWQTSNHIASNKLFLSLIHLLIASLCFGLIILAILLLSTRTAQDIEVESHERRTLKSQSQRAILNLIGKIGASPIQDRHKVIGDAVDATLGKVAYREFIILDISLKITCLRLDVFVYGDTLHHTPC